MKYYKESRRKGKSYVCSTTYTGKDIWFGHIVLRNFLKNKRAGKTRKKMQAATRWP
jgi:hypothetical protein